MYLSVYDIRDSAFELSTITHTQVHGSFSQPKRPCDSITCPQDTHPHPPHTHAPHHTLRSYGFFRVWPARATHARRIPPFYRLVSHYTDTHLYVFSLTLDVPLPINNKISLYPYINKHTLIILIKVQATQTNFHFRCTVFSSQFKSKVVHILTKTAGLWIVLNIDCTPITSISHNLPSHTPNSRLLTSSLSLGVPVPRSTQCIRDV